MKQVIAVLLTMTLPLIASDPQWERLKTLRPGEKIWIDYSKAEKLQSATAEMAGWTEESLAVRIKKSDVVLARSDVRKVAVYGGKSRAKGAGIGALIGAGIGAGLYGALAASHSVDVNAGALIAGGSLFIAGIGALVGLGVGSTKRVTVYQASKK